MGLFDSIRRVVGGGDTTDASDDSEAQPDLVDTRDLDVSAIRDRAESVASEVDVLDFSLSSLAKFDDAIDAGYDEELATADDPTTYDTDVVRFGCYLGEVLIRVYGGEWRQEPDWGVTVTGPEGTTRVAVFDVAERSIETGAVFAAVADRAAVEVGFDGAPADDPDTESTAGEGEPSTDDQPDEPQDAGTESPADKPDETEADHSETESPAQPEAASPDDEPSEATAGDTAAPDPTEAVSDALDRTAELADEAIDRTAETADTESLIEEAEPDDAEPAAGPESIDEPEPDDAETTTAPQSDDAEPDGAETATLNESDERTEPDAEASLFDDGTADDGPTLADAPSAEDAALSGDEPTDNASEEPDAEADDTDDGGELPADADPTEGDDLRATYAEAAEELVSFWTEYDLDYTPESLDRLDDLVGAEWDDDRFDGAQFGDDGTFDERVFTSVSTELGSYFGEVLIRELDAEWSDETATDAVLVEGAEGPMAIPVFKVAGTSLRQQPVFARSYDSLLDDLNADR